MSNETMYAISPVDMYDGDIVGGKPYEIIDFSYDNKAFSIFSGSGQELFCIISGCEHLLDHGCEDSWKIVEKSELGNE